jgi:hypothetical protein
MYQRLDLTTLAPQTYDAGRASAYMGVGYDCRFATSPGYLMHVRQTCMDWHVATVGGSRPCIASHAKLRLCWQGQVSGKENA